MGDNDTPNFAGQDAGDFGLPFGLAGDDGGDFTGRSGVFGLPRGPAGDTLVGVDLNKEENLAALEDAGLVEHMNAARAALRADRASLAAAADSARRAVEAARAASQLTTALKDQREALAILSDEVAVAASNTEKLARGAVPHGFPALEGPQNETMRACLQTLAGRLRKLEEATASAVADLKEAEVSLTRVRRAYEAAAPPPGVPQMASETTPPAVSAGETSLR